MDTLAESWLLLPNMGGTAKFGWVLMDPVEQLLVVSESSGGSLMDRTRVIECPLHA